MSGNLQARNACLQEGHLEAAAVVAAVVVVEGLQDSCGPSRALEAMRMPLVTCTYQWC